MSTTTEPAITHPNWCARGEQCREDRTGDLLHDVSHGSVERTWHARRGGETLDATVYLTRHDNYDGTDAGEPTEPYMTLSGYGPITIDQIEEFGLWLVARAAEYRQATALD